MPRGHLITIGVLLSIVICAGFLTWWWYAAEQAAERSVVDDVLWGESVAHVYTDIEGREVDLQLYENQIVIATVWASWCPQCAGELQLLDRVAKEQGDGQVVVLALNRHEPKEQAQRFLATLPALSHTTLILDQEDHYFKAVQGYAMPETIFYNAAGEIVFHKRGNLTEDEAKNALMSARSAP